jgi:hypothetical protein
MNKRLNGLGKIPTAAFAAPLFGAVAAILIIFMPQWIFERGVVTTGLPSLIPFAKPPLGQTARILAAILSAILVSGVLWIAVSRISKMVKANRPKARGSRIESNSGNAAAHRRPIFAERDLGAPFMSDEAMAIAKDELVADVPAQPETIAIPPFIAPTVEAEVLAAPETALAEEPMPATVAAPEAVDDDSDSIAALMLRLENAVERRQARVGAGAQLPGNINSLRQALGMEAPRAATGR